MINRILTILLMSAMALLLTPQTSLAKSAVWKVQKNQNSLYLAGTFHLLQAEDYPLPKEYDAIFNVAANIIFETDMAEVQGPKFQQAMLKAMASPNRLRDKLSTETWAALEKQLAARGITLAAFDNYKVAMALLTLTLAEYQQLGFNQPGVDLFYFHQAQKASKKTSFLETPEQQIAFLADMGADNPEKMVKYTLNDLDKMPEYVSALSDAWRTGNLAKLNQFGIEEMRRDYPGIYKTLITDRNRNWMIQIDKLIQTPEIEALYVGALHLAGTEGLIAELQKRGYQVTQL